MNMRKAGLLSLMLSVKLFASSLLVTSDVTTNTVWNADTVIIDKEFFDVKEGARLTIEAGTHVVFKRVLSFFTVRGTITAVGTSEDSIYFSRENPTNIWRGIRIITRNRIASNRDSSFLEYCNLQKAQAATDSLYTRKGGVLLCGGGNFVSLKHSSITNVKGDLGGAVYCDSGSSVLIDSCYFAQNEGSYYGGGAIMTSASELFIRNSRFDRNFSRNGGAIWIGKRTKAEINNCIFYRDSTTSINPSKGELAGGAMVIYGPADVTLRNCLFFYCSSYSKGGAIFSSDASIRLINCTIANNLSRFGGGIYFGRDSAASSPILTNTIEGGNGKPFGVSMSRDSAGCGIYLDSSVTPVFRYCQLYDTVYDYTIKPYKGEFTNSRYYETDFLCWRAVRDMPDTLPEGYLLYSEFSKKDPGINSGTPDTMGLGLPQTDVLGQLRINGTSIDIGAIEFHHLLSSVSFPPVRKQKFPYHGQFEVNVYSLNGRKLGMWNIEMNSLQSVKNSLKCYVPKGLFLITVNNSGKQISSEKLLVN